MSSPTGMPITWELANPKIDEREVLDAMRDREPDLANGRPGLLVIADKDFASKEFEDDLAMAAAIWHNHKTDAPVLRSLTAFDH
ncbi:hypothetical protein [Streptomyces sp. NPDC048665]|uniref:hypothetical protein n=1 Tax=Streptomyces sp. NPDC048665 TaxID=3155490 RepID=UPI003422E28E